MAGSGKKKGNRVQVRLRCTEDGVTIYITTKNKKNTPSRMELMKYNPRLRRRTLFKEEK